MAGDAVGWSDLVGAPDTGLAAAAVRTLCAVGAPAGTARHSGAGVVSAVVGAAIIFLTATPFVSATRPRCPILSATRACRARQAARGTAGEGATGRAERVRPSSRAWSGLTARELPDLPALRHLCARPGRYPSTEDHSRPMPSHAGEGQAVRPGDLETRSLAHDRPVPGLWLGPRRAAGRVSKTQPNYLGVAIDLESQLPNIRWLIANRCDLGQPLRLLSTNLRAVADSSRYHRLRRHAGRPRHQVRSPIMPGR